jgi:hypothetical protein
MIRRIALGVISASIALGYGASVAVAAQPNVECPDNPALRVPGFNTSGFATAEGVYANGDATGGLSSGNSRVVSQYDIACFKFNAH